MKRITQLSLDITLPTDQLPLPFAQPVERDEHYTLFRSRGERYPWRWEGAGKFAGQNSTKRFATEQAAEDDAAKTLKH